MPPELGGKWGTVCLNTRLPLVSRTQQGIFHYRRRLALNQEAGVETSAVLSFATQHGMPPELGRNWGTVCLNTMFLLPIYGVQREADLILKFYESLRYP